ncbi:DUF4355 domain-containing protein [Ruminococcus sp. OA3]|uniref:DUF4355 domain-containing protein n=1 Tax=Ruminococcus sp. OA3 TaxID=2914164 RepID=UPI001F0590C6|nr:DUF4355 domain-containing protein [Ruminococcus sp. OA3]MCH1982478.1 DUF4355 domain-containing protein [Ruminococcus sp. OA3]
MRKKYLNGNCKIPMNLQVFAEDGDGAGADDGNGGGSGDDGGDGDDGAGDNNPPSFDDFLKDTSHQAEFDRRVQKAIDTAVNNAQQKWQALTDDKLSEAEKLAKMTKEEKANYLHQKKERELAARESEIMKKELMAEAKNTLATKKIPSELAEVLNYTDADSCSKSIAVVEKAFQKAVEDAVQDRLKGGTPPKKAPEGDEKALETQVENIMMGRQ